MILEIEIQCALIQINPTIYTNGILTLKTNTFINFATLGSFIWEGSFHGRKVLINQKNIHTDPDEGDIVLPEGLTLNKTLLAAKIKEIVKRQTS